MAPEDLLRRGLAELGLALPRETVDRLLLFASLLLELGVPLGLTGLRDPEEVVVKHLLDSLTVLPLLPDGPLLDLGTGAGLPGLVLKVASPGREVWLADPRKKSLSFLTYAAGVLGLRDLHLVRTRVEEGAPLPEGHFAAVVSRAVTSLGELWRMASPFLRSGGVLLALKGPGVGEEVRRLRRAHPGLAVQEHALRLPVSGDPRVIVSLRQREG